MVIRRRTIIAGLTDYFGASKDDVISELVRFKKIAEVTIKNLNDLKIKSTESFSKNIVKEVNSFIDKRTADYNCYVDDFNQLIRELPRQITEGHCKILKQIFLDVEKQGNICKDFKNDNLSEASDKQEFRIIDKVYEEARQLTVDFLDIANLERRLSTFIGSNTKLSKRGNRTKNLKNEAESEIDKSSWRMLPGTFIVRKQMKTGYAEFYICWNDSELKILGVKKLTQMHSLFDLFIANKSNNSLIQPKEIKKFLDTKQPPNKAVRDVNDALVHKLRRKLPKERERIPDLIIGYSNKEGGYKTLIPIVEESTLDTVEKEEHLLEEPPKEFLPRVQVTKRGGKAKM
ncbi:MAG TPA: hypothetical protein DCL35_07260 [Candidatus Omnitrophica bacterium]|nr:hypothetical protein [Candidatus Omnitrophota bacterium]